MKRGRLYDNDATRIKAMIDDAAPTGPSGSGIIGGFGGGGSSSGGGGGSIPSPSVLTSPFLPATLEVPNNGSATLDFGKTAAITQATCFLYFSRGGTTAGVGGLEILINGAGTAEITPRLTPLDGAGITYAVDASSGNLILAATADNTGGDTTIEVAYMTRGVSVAAVFGWYEAVRGSYRERGRFSVQQVNGGSPTVSRRPSGDNSPVFCGIDFTGSIANGIVTLTATDALMNGDDTAIVFDYVTLGANGAWQPWKTLPLAVPDSSSANATFETLISGALIWDSAVRDIAAGETQQYTFPVGDGCEHILYYLLRGDLYEQGQIDLFNDLATGDLVQTVWDFDIANPAGVSFTGSMNTGSPVLSITADSSDANPTTLYFTWIGEAQI